MIGCAPKGMDVPAYDPLWKAQFNAAAPGVNILPYLAFQV